MQGAVLRFQWEEAKSDTGEADLAIVQYWQWFRDCHHLVYMDDGDSLPIALLHAFDRLQNGTFCGKEFWICKPRKGICRNFPPLYTARGTEGISAFLNFKNRHVFQRRKAS